MMQTPQIGSPGSDISPRLRAAKGFTSESQAPDQATDPRLAQPMPVAS